MLQFVRDKRAHLHAREIGDYCLASSVTQAESLARLLVGNVRQVLTK